MHKQTKKSNLGGWSLGVSTTTPPGAIILGWGQGFTTIEAKAGHPNLSWIRHNDLDSQGSYNRDFTHLDALEGLPVSEAVLGDLDGDDLDAFLVGRQEGELRFNDEQGQFTNQSTGIPTGENQNMTAEDFNGNGYPDIFAATTHNDTIWVWWNDGKGSFLPEEHMRSERDVP